ncbi:uncharacterized protein LOC112195949 isoform X3 [Rosa chinensis]|uniref:uncharacterized protein LOC112195949 isoform X3 n=1 Tax=Rosa chinensis TaxID=74649 RepID=UPI001AD8ED51|nr:uncharacterized protein LOC112195949 isoform X3 [Rosa chinensis]
MWHMFSQPRLQRLFPKEMERMFQLMLKRSKIRGPLLPGEFLCRTYILNALDDSLYDIFSSFKTARELWESLDNKYKTEVACSKKFVIGKFLNYKMVNAKSVFKQVEELQVIVHELDEEEDHRRSERADATSMEPTANMVGGSPSKAKFQKNKGKNDVAKPTLATAAKKPLAP